MKTARKRLLHYAAGAVGLGAVGLVVTYAALPNMLLEAYRVWLRRHHGLERCSARVGDWQIPYLDSAPESGGPAVLLLHGFGDTKDNLIELAAGLSDQYRVVLPDLPGFGETAIRPRAEYSDELYVATVLGLLERLDLAPVHLAGYSMGGLIAVKAADRAPQRVRTLTLLAPAGVSGDRPSRVEEMIRSGQGNPLVYRDRESFKRLLRLNFNRMPEIPSFAVRALAEHGRRRAGVYERVFDRILGDPDATDLRRQIASLEMPVLLVGGGRDQIVDPSAWEHWKQLQPELQLVRIPGGSHAMVHQQTEAIQCEIRQHLQER